MKELIGLIAAGLFVIGMVPYYRDIFRRKTKPHLYTYLIWSIVTVIAFFGQWVAGGGPGAWRTGVAAISTIGVFFLSFKYGTEDVNKFDSLCLIGAIVSIIPWVLMKDPVISVVLATCIDVLAFIPTIRKTYRDPSTETYGSWILNITSHGISFFALGSYNVTTLVFPTAIFIMNSILIMVIGTGRRRLRH